MLWQLLGAIAFYTCIPIPPTWPLDFQGIARFAPVVGLAIGGLLGLADYGLFVVGMPVLLRSSFVVVAWVGLTGGLHLDGAMDTADGLAVNDPTRRLQVMADSATGAFGAMCAIAILLLKTTALAVITNHRVLILMAACGWGRWGQLMAIIQYPYLKATGKGAFHKAAFKSPLEGLPTLILLLGLSGLQMILAPTTWQMGIAIAISGCSLAVLSGAWFNCKLGGHTGDTYGATVEWTETLLLCLLSVF
jgi:adenosylcobinamide-GDP ribazoletransferase